MTASRKPVKIRNVNIGDGVPKICVPIVGMTDDEILESARAIVLLARDLEEKYPGKRLDMIEFRADYYDKVTNKTMLSELMANIREIIGDRLLLFTYRSEDEGGFFRHDRAENMLDDIYEWIIEGKRADLIDIELLQGNYYVVRTAAKAHDNGIKVIMSYHNFEETPHDEDLEEKLFNMELLGGDILKIAAMPKNSFDVRRLMELTERVVSGKREGYPVTHPLVTMSMGELGRESRIKGKETGSAITFAFVGEESAPGQLRLEEMFELL